MQSMKGCIALLPAYLPIYCFFRDEIHSKGILEQIQMFILELIGPFKYIKSLKRKFAWYPYFPNIPVTFFL